MLKDFVVCQLRFGSVVQAWVVQYVSHYYQQEPSSAHLIKINKPLTALSGRYYHWLCVSV